ncbi:restriction endonuclease subunit S [Arenimonas sp.]|uniref:restriction endonuclease subunit S n=1 Tax=Arenimonas sp. TaxID=1872635 RepID=UPI0035B21A0A
MIEFVGPIKDVCLGIYDGPHATPKESDVGPVFLGIKNVTKDGRLDLSEIRHVSEQEFTQWTRRVVPRKDDIVFSYEATLHLYALIPEGFRGCLGRRMALVRPDTTKVVPRYLHYYFLSPAWKALMLSNVMTGATVDRIPIARFPRFEVRLPRLSAQQRIADTLSAYDDLIENNRRRIALLEQSARLLYREWFVHLRFPGHEHVKVVDGVPEGWRNSNVGQEADFVGRGITPAYDDEADGLVINQKCIRDRLLNLNQARRQSKVVPDQKIVRFGDVLINSTGEGTLGRVAQVLKEVPNCTVDSHVTIVRPSGRIGSLYLGRAISEFEELLKTMGRGATNQTELSRDDVSALSILVPSSSIASEFEDQMSPVIRLIVNLLDQNEALSLARDLLLPRLMSGDLVV